jgi:precorrin-6B methylase 2
VPCSVDTLLRMLELAAVGPDDVFVDVGSGVGRAMALAHLLTGAGALGIEIQPELVRCSRELLARLGSARLAVLEGDAAALADHIRSGSVFFLYCPFGGARLDRVIDQLESIAATRTIRVCTVDVPPLERAWLEPLSLAGDLAVYRSVR